MKRIFLIPALGLIAMVLTGCANTGDAIAAEVPGGYQGQAKSVPSSGAYALFHVTECDAWGTPTKYEKVATVNLNANERVGFDYVLPADKTYSADAHSDVVAFAGPKFRKNLGPIQTMEEHYYWCKPDDWSGYWAGHPGQLLGKRIMLY